MIEQDHESKNIPLREISVLVLITKTREIIRDIRSKWILIFTCGLIAALLGLACSVFLKTKYTAVCTFVLEETGREGMLNQYAGLASLAGIELGNNGGDIFKGDNIFELYKSRLMLEKTLLSEVDSNGKREKLIEWFIADNRLREKWKKNDDINAIAFNGDPLKFNMAQDSIITDIVRKFIQNDLDVNKPDKKLSVIRVSFSSKDQLFAKMFTDKLVENVNSFYIQTKITKALQNVQVLQRQADSVKKVLTISLYGAANAFDAAPNANPSLSSLKVPSQKRLVDVQANTAIYSEMVKNLEIAKISLRQLTPLIQYIDQPVLPLDNNKVTRTRGMIVGFIAGSSLCVFYLAVSRFFRSVLNSTI
jgi:hypothetical protein